MKPPPDNGTNHDLVAEKKITAALSLTLDPAINYAFQQNAIPVVKELRLQNDGVARKDLVIRVTTEPAFAAPVEIRVQALDANGEFRVSPLDLKLSPGFLSELNEKVAGWLKVEVVEGDTLLCARTEVVSLLALSGDGSKPASWGRPKTRHCGKVRH